MGIKENIEKLKLEIPKNVELLAVSKTKPIEDLKQAYEAGIRDFGENKVQELVSKEEVLPKDIRWHLIGNLQTNKVKYLVDKVYLIHSLSSIKLLNEIERVFEKNNTVANVLIQINIGREESKSGILKEGLQGLIEAIETCNYVLAKGIMVIIPKGDEKNNRKYFKETKEIFDYLKVRKYKNIKMEVLSMGMTHDFNEAIEEGSTLVRIGQGIFGERNYSTGGEK
ncbi:YggS family pyridoxal phosphate-dependent enzyme [Clostridium botulinum]|uniref:Pyridoxal phosphate homeostasis protein n=1 Tax=Clostridium botulinum TaxID=1491 RepID=A0A6B4JK20_CLOBO|nr:YggS family pyridoxal phosphate-dependent enzyme [Clostridium botulinum]EES48808.1 pyridoxal phosphate enzyme, YggS family [Clostridium botulinum E1 str. 'BoNT E Beluga']MBY6760438.1 YggS family pyridoxal phosphate-dependent enzyme [Clostridium botulinum]MBY6919345.1 YggS family pyridoxal phosphate-dependent enzyme [Clostridium botulinum]MCR1130223.1 YggS family pyridoxal phosphate-dependent enzyme [Clostridium botulinum]NFH69115.1 YggS family pyridoxal phosphate-dependent enzyme [Clostridi